MEKFLVVGMGPGGRDYLTLRALKAIEAADLLVGSPRFLALFPERPVIALPPGTAQALDLLEARRATSRIALLVSGDPGLYSLLGAIRRRFPREAYEVVPGISSFQLAFARLGLGWEGAVVVSVHGRGLESLLSLDPTRPGVVFLDAINDAARVASALARRMGGDRVCVVARDLGGVEESLLEARLSEVAAMDMGGLCVLIVP